MKWFLVCFRKYATFAGRAQRMEYWMFMLICALIAVAAFVLMSAVGFLMNGSRALGYIAMVVYSLLITFFLAAILPALAVSVRRLHDTGRSGWWWFISFIPVVGPLVFLVFMLQDSEADENAYGPNPSRLARNS